MLNRTNKCCPQGTPCPGLQTETSGDESEPSVNSGLRVCHAADLPERWHGVRDASLNGNSQERTCRQKAE